MNICFFHLKLNFWFGQTLKKSHLLLKNGADEFVDTLIFWQLRQI